MNLRSLIFLFCFLSVVFSGKTQTVFSAREIDLGDLYTLSERFDDILITNKGQKKAYILRVEKPAEVVFLASTDVLLPDSSLSFRLQVNPKQKGPFSYNVNVLTSDAEKPTVIRIKGNVKEYAADDYSALQGCPTFGNEPSRVETSKITIITVDEETRKPLASTTVNIIRNGMPVGAWITGKKGSFQQETTPGQFYFVATHEGYISKEAGIYIGPKVREVTIPLKTDPKFVPPVTIPPAEERPDIAIVVPPAKVEENLEKELKSQETDSVIRKELPELASLPTDNFESSYFKPVNVVFILDVSSSMRGNEKLDLMKYSLNQLVNSMRREDHIALVTYSDDADVLLSPTPCDQKDAVLTKVAALKAIGQTAGGKGIKTGFTQAMKQYSEDKANMVIIITDGAFNKGSDDYKKQVEKYASKGITFSVVGIKDSEKDEKLMREAAAFGKGRYIPIDKLADAQNNLLQEIRIASFRVPGR